jgi:hypothetical protein
MRATRGADTVRDVYGSRVLSEDTTAAELESHLMSYLVPTLPVRTPKRGRRTSPATDCRKRKRSPENADRSWEGGEEGFGGGDVSETSEPEPAKRTRMLEGPITLVTATATTATAPDTDLMLIIDQQRRQLSDLERRLEVSLNTIALLTTYRRAIAPDLATAGHTLSESGGDGVLSKNDGGTATP